MSSVAESIRHKLTVTDYYRMGEIGIFHEDDHIELIEGDMIYMMLIDGKHASIASRNIELNK